uniref:BTB/POZ KCTD-like protein n=1 Tax=Clandestinovirus TaxID=2831644 RepID=A0A8F8KM07_9VIRU|nr:BTB/POZ KCTD-like protein [Clandestinovirus]
MSYFTFNVGGQRFCVSKTAIDTCTPNYFSMIIQRDQDQLIQKIEHFIDRDPKLFEYVLLFLRGYSNPLPESEAQLINLRDDALFYGLQPLVSMINSKLSETASTQEVLNDKQEPSWVKDGLLVQYKNSMKDAIEYRRELHGESMSDAESEKFIRDHLHMDEFALDRDDISSWPTSALKSAIEKLETIGKRFQMAACLKLYQEYTFRALMSGTGHRDQEEMSMDTLPSPANLEEIMLKMSKKNVNKYSWLAMIGKKFMEMLNARAEADRRRWEAMRMELPPIMFGPFPGANLLDGQGIEQHDGVLLGDEPVIQPRPIQRGRIVMRCPYDTTTMAEEAENLDDVQIDLNIDEPISDEIKSVNEDENEEGQDAIIEEGQDAIIEDADE